MPAKDMSPGTLLAAAVCSMLIHLFVLSGACFINVNSGISHFIRDKKATITFVIIGDSLFAGFTLLPDLQLYDN